MGTAPVEPAAMDEGAPRFVLEFLFTLDSDSFKFPKKCKVWGGSRRALKQLEVTGQPGQLIPMHLALVNHGQCSAL